MEEVLAIAKEAGFDVSAEDIEGTAGTAAKGELSDDELENVAGGWRLLGKKAFKDYILHKHGVFVRLSNAEVSKLKAAGYQLKTNGAYSKGDYYDIIHPEGYSILKMNYDSIGYYLRILGDPSK